MKKLTFILPIFILGLNSCGPSNDAKDICNCYKEGIKLGGDEAEAKLTECMELLDKYTKKHKSSGTLDEFMEEYNKCR